MTERNAQKELRALKTRIGVFYRAKTRNTLHTISFWKSLCQHPKGVIAERIFWKLTIPFKRQARQRKSPHSSLLARSAWAYPGFLSMKRLGVSLLPPGWDASPSQGYPPHVINKEPIANSLTVQAWPAQLASVSGFSSSLAQMFQGL